ncbi:hypothetical protein [Pedobacter insulae]|uniref:Uncharacterized protein n=1 Tax=Pedobacter insulae TaxID=414048 RepID=A0A1I2VZR0_9SPHI|nr:hypothetical protein [Pedobacter insulae]SFG93827.1 hypothetical protein SAMN04489864_103332 [Pedobacter insulae]
MIRTLFALFLVISVGFKLPAQESLTTSTEAKKYIKEAVEFLTNVKKKELADPAFTLVNVPKYTCFLYTVDDSLSFNNEELAQIANEIEFPKVTSWRTILPSNIRFLEENFVKANSKSIKNRQREIKFFKKKFGGCYHNFSAPIFLRNYSFCLFYMDKICAGGESKGELQVFEKHDGVWKQLTSRCEWTE